MSVHTFSILLQTSPDMFELWGSAGSLWFLVGSRGPEPCKVDFRPSELTTGGNTAFWLVHRCVWNPVSKLRFLGSTDRSTNQVSVRNRRLLLWNVSNLQSPGTLQNKTGFFRPIYGGFQMIWAPSPQNPEGTLKNHVFYCLSFQVVLWTSRWRTWACLDILMWIWRSTEDPGVKR